VIGWGLPPGIPQVVSSDIRSSYAFDEDDILTPLSFARPDKLDFDPRQYQWGTLHLYLVLASLELAETVGYLHHPWRNSYYQILPGDFEKVYGAGRLVSVLAAIASIAATFFFALECTGKLAAFWAALLVAASPAHLLGSAQIRVDLTLTALLIATAWLGIRAAHSRTPASFFVLGLLAGASVSAKYTAIFIIVPCLLVALASVRFAPRSACAVLLGAPGGFLLGEPVILMKPSLVIGQVFSVLQKSYAIPDAFRIPPGELLRIDALHSVRFLIGAPAAVLAVVGLAFMLRRLKIEDRLVLAVLAGGVLSLVPLLWPMLRYELPLLPFLAVAAAATLDRLPRAWHIAAGCLALIFPLGASVDQVRFMRAPHPANRILPVILNEVPAGTPIARLVPELPPLDRKTYPMDLNPLLDNLSTNPPAWVLIADLPIQPYPLTTTRLLSLHYDLVGSAGNSPLFPWATIGSAGAPYDWKYTNPPLTLYRKRSS
jgi:hypothetical protein